MFTHAFLEIFWMIIFFLFINIPSYSVWAILIDRMQQLGALSSQLHNKLQFIETRHKQALSVIYSMTVNSMNRRVLLHIILITLSAYHALTADGCIDMWPRALPLAVGRYGDWVKYILYILHT